MAGGRTLIAKDRESRELEILSLSYNLCLVKDIPLPSVYVTVYECRGTCICVFRSVHKRYHQIVILASIGRSYYLLMTT